MALQEVMNTHFVGRIKDSRRTTAKLQGFPRDAQSRKSNWIRLFKGQFTKLREVQPGAGRLYPLRPAERISNGSPHIGRAELSQDRSIDIRDHAVDDGLRTDQDLHALGRHLEQMMRLDELEPFVHHG